MAPAGTAVLGDKGMVGLGRPGLNAYKVTENSAQPHTVRRLFAIMRSKFSKITVTGATASALDHAAYGKPHMAGHGGQHAVVNTHDAEALAERAAVIARGHAAVQEVGHHRVGIYQRGSGALRGFHHAYAPVYIGRVTVTQVVRLALRQVCPGVESLMTHQHTMAERAPAEVLGGDRRRWRTKWPSASTTSVSP